MTWDELECLVLDGMATLFHYKNDVDNRRSVLKQFQEIAKKTGHKDFIRQAEKKSALYEASPRSTTGPNDTPPSRDIDKLTNDEIDRMHRRLLEAGGVNVDGTDELSRLARLGLKDRNPERALKHCKHLHVEIVNFGPIWSLVGLPSTGRKLLYCALKDVFTEGHSLDEILDEFKKTYCNKCDSCSPRPTDWKWKYRWQRERKHPPRMETILEKLRD
jgi:hypothetical protein